MFLSFSEIGREGIIGEAGKKMTFVTTTRKHFCFNDSKEGS